MRRLVLLVALAACGQPAAPASPATPSAPPRPSPAAATTPAPAEAGAAEPAHAPHAAEHHAPEPTPAEPATPELAAPGTGHVHPHTHRRFDDAAKWSKTFDNPKRDAWQKPDAVVTMLAIQPGMTVADLGAGTGYFMARLSRAVGDKGRVLVLDVEADMVRFMTERAAREKLGNVTAKQVAPDDPGLVEKVDRVLVVDTWHHLGDRVAYAKKLYAGLRPGGFVMVVDFTQETRLGPPVAARVKPEEVLAELRAAGFSPVVVDGKPLPEQFVIVGRR